MNLKYYLFAFTLFFFGSIQNELASSFVIETEGSFQKLNIKILHGLPLIPVTLNYNSYLLVLDLGSEHSSLNEEMILKSKLRPTDKIIKSMNIYGTRREQQVYIASEVKLGEYLVPTLEFAVNLPIDVAHENNVPEELTYGKIGRAPFTDVILFIDRSKGIFFVEKSIQQQPVDPNKYAVGNWIASDFVLDRNNGIMLPLLKANGKLQYFILDTGSNYSFINDESLKVQALDIEQEPLKIALKLVNGTSLKTLLFYPQKLSNVGLEGIIGFDFFDSYAVCIDFHHKKIFFK